MDGIIFIGPVKDSRVRSRAEFVGERKLEVGKLLLRPKIAHSAQTHPAFLVLLLFHAADCRAVLFDLPCPLGELKMIEGLTVEENFRRLGGEDAKGKRREATDYGFHGKTTAILGAPELGRQEQG